MVSFKREEKGKIFSSSFWSIFIMSVCGTNYCMSPNFPIIVNFGQKEERVMLNEKLDWCGTVASLRFSLKINFLNYFSF
jgi:hypothetical protein